MRLSICITEPRQSPSNILSNELRHSRCNLGAIFRPHLEEVQVADVKSETAVQDHIVSKQNAYHIYLSMYHLERKNI